MSIKDRPKLNKVIEKLMQEVGINEADLARKTNIPQPTLHRILSGATKSPRGDSLAPLANFFSITINQLMGVDELPQDRIAGTHNSRIHGWTPIPLISLEQATKWDIFQKELRSNNWKDWVSTDLNLGDQAFSVRVKGDSMTPTFPEDTILVFEPQVNPHNRDYILIALDGHKTATFRQILMEGDDSYLKAINEEFETIKLKGNKNKIIGVLAQARSDFLGVKFGR